MDKIEKLPQHIEDKLPSMINNTAQKKMRCQHEQKTIH